MKDYFRNNKWGFLRETKADAEKAKKMQLQRKNMTVQNFSIQDWKNILLSFSPK